MRVLLRSGSSVDKRRMAHKRELHELNICSAMFFFIVDPLSKLLQERYYLGWKRKTRLIFK